MFHNFSYFTFFARKSTNFLLKPKWQVRLITKPWWKKILCSQLYWLNYSVHCLKADLLHYTQNALKLECFWKSCTSTAICTKIKTKTDFKNHETKFLFSYACNWDKYYYCLLLQGQLEFIYNYNITAVHSLISVRYSPLMKDHPSFRW